MKPTDHDLLIVDGACGSNLQEMDIPASAWEGREGCNELLNVTAPDAVRHAFTTLFEYGVPELFPELKIVVLESGASWLGYWLDRMDAVYASPQGLRLALHFTDYVGAFGTAGATGEGVAVGADSVDLFVGGGWFFEYGEGILGEDPTTQ